MQNFVESVTDDDLHAKRVLSLSHAALGVIHAASLGVTVIGRGLAQARSLDSKHARALRFGMGLSSNRIAKPARRVYCAMAVVLLAFLGTGGGAVGLDRRLKANTLKKRTHSIIFDGTFYYSALPNVREEQFQPPMAKSVELLHKLAFFRQAFGVVG
jgi:hypothetical protein